MEGNHRHLEEVVNVREGNWLISTGGYGNAEVQQIERPDTKAQCGRSFFDAGDCI